VNNNIVLIDTYDRLRREGVAAYDAIIQTCASARAGCAHGGDPILGVLPIAFGMMSSSSPAKSSSARRYAMVDQSLPRSYSGSASRRAHPHRYASNADAIENMREWRMGWVRAAARMVRPPGAGLTLRNEQGSTLRCAAFGFRL